MEGEIDSFLCSVSGLTLSGIMRTSGIWKALKVELMLLHIRGSQLRWFGHLSGNAEEVHMYS